jgi:hypothetical protein
VNQISDEEKPKSSPQGPETPEPARAEPVRTKSAEHHEEEPAKKETSKNKYRDDSIVHVNNRKSGG